MDQNRDQKCAGNSKDSGKEEQRTCCGCGKGADNPADSDAKKLEKLKYEVAQEMGLEEEEEEDLLGFSPEEGEK